MNIIMKKWKQWIVPGILVIGLISTGVWGYQESKIRQNLQNRAESQYQKSFYELTWHLDNISGQLAQTLINSSKEQSILSIATIWRQVFAAQANIGSLPLAYVSLSNTEKFLSDTGEVASALLNQVSQGEGGFDKKSSEIIEELYNRSKSMKEDLDKLGAKILNKELSWTQVEVATITTNKELEDNTIVDGFELMEKKMEEYPEINLGENLSAVEPDAKKVRGKENITQEEAKKIALSWWYPDSSKYKAKLAYEGIGDIPTFGLEILPIGEETEPVYIDVSKLDGAVVWAMKRKVVEKDNIDLNEGERRVQTFLEKRNYNNFTVVQVQKQDNTGIYTLAPRQEDVLLYPDQIKLQIALDNGEILGYEGTNYYMYHKKRELSKATLSKEELRKQINPNLKVELIRPALIVNTWGKEVLTWEVRGTFSEEKFIIFYNANTGGEEVVTRITPPTESEFNVA
ncbi:MAG: germination protein YpeB [Clostridia bacterium]|nr:germination protein YpeB [Clostridia bacterium]